MIFILLIPAGIAGLVWWLTGKESGIFAGFIPVQIISFAIAFAIMESQPTRESSFYAFWLGWAVTMLPWFCREFRRQQAIAQEEKRRQAAGDTGNVLRWVGPKDRA